MYEDVATTVSQVVSHPVSQSVSQPILFSCSWGVHGVTSIDAQLDKLYLPMFHAQKLNVPVEDLDQEEVNNTKEKVKVWLGALNQQLNDRPFICGDK